MCRNSRRRAATHGGERLSWQEQPRPEGAERAVSLPLIHINEEEEVVHGNYTGNTPGYHENCCFFWEGVFGFSVAGVSQ